MHNFWSGVIPYISKFDFALLVEMSAVALPTFRLTRDSGDEVFHVRKEISTYVEQISTEYNNA